MDRRCQALNVTVRMVTSCLNMLIDFYCNSFGISGHDSLEDKQAKFLEWIGAVRP